MKFDAHLVAELDHHTKVAALLDAVDAMASSAAQYGIPKPETIARVFKAARAISDYAMYEETHA